MTGWVRVLPAVLVLVAAATTPAATTPAATTPAATTPVAAARAAGYAHVVPRDPMADDGERQAALVADEDLRLDQIRSQAPQLSDGWRAPFRLDTYGGSTLVLTRRALPYTITDLLQYGPETVERQPDGAYLLAENLYVNVGAHLDLFDPEGLTLRLASTRRGFVSIVSYGGTLDLRGTNTAPLRITSWDPRTRGPDTDLVDGRAYVRAMGGRFTLSYATVSDLGFWSGRTGGVGLTGNDLPTSGEDAGTDPVGDQAVGSRYAEPDLPGITGAIIHGTLTGNAFGLFVANSRGVTISDITVESSVGDGVVLHRFVARTPITRVLSRRNGGDGFVLSQATERTRLERVTAHGNAGNGFTLDGQPLADGPSASGDSLASYGWNAVSNSVARSNGRYGVELVGGHDIGVLGTRVEGGDMGIVVRAAASRVTVAGNQVVGARRHGIAVHEGSAAVTVRDNTVAGGEIGIHVRDAAVRVQGNTVRDTTRHGVSLVGSGAGTVVRHNLIAGTGPRAVDVSRSTGDIDLRDNDVAGWVAPRSFWTDVGHRLTPTTLIWVVTALLVLWTAGRVRRWRGGAEPRRIGAHPYPDKLPMRSSQPLEITPDPRRAGREGRG